MLSQHEVLPKADMECSVCMLPLPDDGCCSIWAPASGALVESATIQGVFSWSSRDAEMRSIWRDSAPAAALPACPVLLLSFAMRWVHSAADSDSFDVFVSSLHGEPGNFRLLYVDFPTTVKCKEAGCLL